MDFGLGLGLELGLGFGLGLGLELGLELGFGLGLELGSRLDWSKAKKWLLKTAACIIHVSLHLFSFYWIIKIDWPLSTVNCIIWVAFKTDLTIYHIRAY